MVYPAVLLIGLRLPALLTVPNWLQQLKTAQYLLPVTQAQRGHRRLVLATVLGLPSLGQAMVLSSPRLSMAVQYTPQATRV